MKRRKEEGRKKKVTNKIPVREWTDKIKDELRAYYENPFLEDSEKSSGGKLSQREDENQCRGPAKRRLAGKKKGRYSREIVEIEKDRFLCRNKVTI